MFINQLYVIGHQFFGCASCCNGDGDILLSHWLISMMMLILILMKRMMEGKLFLHWASLTKGYALIVKLLFETFCHLITKILTNHLIYCSLCFCLLFLSCIWTLLMCIFVLTFSTIMFEIIFLHFNFIQSNKFRLFNMNENVFN